MKITDSRSDEQFKTHYILVGGVHEKTVNHSIYFACEFKDYKKVLSFFSDFSGFKLVDLNKTLEINNKNHKCDIIPY